MTLIAIVRLSGKSLSVAPLEPSNLIGSRCLFRSTYTVGLNPSEPLTKLCRSVRQAILLRHLLPTGSMIVC
jgi:hypothetical protein